MKYLLLDVAGTILHKPALFAKIKEVLDGYGYAVAHDKLKFNHKVLSEAIKFPDRTDAGFYHYFNAELLYSLGIIPTDELLNAIFKSCSYLPWEKFEDTDILQDIDIPIGIISNFNATLKEKLQNYFGSVFSHVFVSEEMGVAKPSADFYKKALDRININPKEVLYIGDSFKLDLQPALALGMNSYVIDRDHFYPNNPNTIQSLSELEKLIGL
jgi:putative hydrolase of the HAD superfamily